MKTQEVMVICPTNGLPARPYCVKGTAHYYVEPQSDTIFQAHMPSVSDMSQYADEEYQAGVYREYANSRDLKIATAHSRLDELGRLSRGNRLLDVGCATGFFMEAATEDGFDTYGVEFSNVAISLARDDIRERIICGDVNALLAQNAGKFDAVTAFDIIEHVRDPAKLLREIHDVLVPGGVLAVSTPDTGHFLRYLMGSRWPMLQPMQHTVLFSRKGLQALLESCGYHEVRIVTAHKTLTLDYLTDQLAATNPAIHRFSRSARRLLPAGLRRRPITVSIGEMAAYARRT